ncbi:MAG: hypothetical protein KDI74_14115 [Gammaproteobacteria bacterium]|nr:hypothetical protein [Gammaproteobacteria bacterium]
MHDVLPAGEVPAEGSPGKASVLQSHHIFIQELRNPGLYDQPSQPCAVFLPVRSAGVVADARRYEFVLSRRIINEVKGIPRVAYDISGRLPATMKVMACIEDPGVTPKALAMLAEQAL